SQAGHGISLRVLIGVRLEYRQKFGFLVDIILAKHGGVLGLVIGLVRDGLVVELPTVGHRGFQPVVDSYGKDAVYGASQEIGCVSRRVGSGNAGRIGWTLRCGRGSDLCLELIGLAWLRRSDRGLAGWCGGRPRGWLWRSWRGRSWRGGLGFLPFSLGAR